MQLTKLTNQMPEKEYRNLPGRISSSDIRTFIQSRKKFYKQCILQERQPSDDTVSTILGNIVDCLLTCPDEIDNKFVISVAGVPVGQVGELCEALYKRALRTINEQGVQTSQFKKIFQDAVQHVKYKGGIEELAFKGKNLEKILQLFMEPDKNGAVGELYYKEKLYSIGKTVVSVDMMTTGERLAQEMRDSPYTGYIVNKVTEGNREIFHQLIILFTYKDIQMRAMLDKCEVDHDKKTIQPYDIKTTYDNEGFDKAYLKGLYIQAATYDAALIKWAKEHDLQGYEILPMKYPVADTANENMPLLYQLSTEDLRKAYTGFKLKGSNKVYPGFDECIEQIKWHVESGNWRISKDAYQKEGKLYMNFDYQ